MRNKAAFVNTCGEICGLIWTDLVKVFPQWLLGGGLESLKKTDEDGCFDDVSL